VIFICCMSSQKAGGAFPPWWPPNAVNHKRDAVANRHVNQAMAASGTLIDFVDSMFDAMGREVDPSLLDCSLEPLIVRPPKD
jgi:hypothetical protein